MPIQIYFVCVSGIKFAEAKVLVNSLVLPFAISKDMYDFLFFRRWALTVHLGSCTLYFSC